MLVGLVAYGKVTSLPGATLVALDPAVAGRLLGTPGSFTTIDLTAERRVSPSSSVARSRPALPAGLQAVTGQQAADESVRGGPQGGAVPADGPDDVRRRVPVRRRRS